MQIAFAHFKSDKSFRYSSAVVPDSIVEKVKLDSDLIALYEYFQDFTEKILYTKVKNDHMRARYLLHAVSLCKKLYPDPVEAFVIITAANGEVSFLCNAKEIDDVRQYVEEVYKDAFIQLI